MRAITSKFQMFGRGGVRARACVCVCVCLQVDETIRKNCLKLVKFEVEGQTNGEDILGRGQM